MANTYSNDFIQEILNYDSIDQFKKIDNEKVLNFSKKKIVVIINNILLALDIKIIFKYKYDTHITIYNKIIDIFCSAFCTKVVPLKKKKYDLYKVVKDNENCTPSCKCNDMVDKLLYRLLFRFTGTYKGQDLLRKFYFSYYNFNEIFDIFQKAAYIGTIQTFIFWESKILHYDNSDDFKKKIRLKFKMLNNSLLCSACRNSDDRILKHMLLYSGEGKLYGMYEERTSTFYFQLFRSVFRINNNKINMRKIRLLSKYLEINKYFNELFSTINNLKLFIKLSKYYYCKNKHFDVINISNNISSNMNPFYNLSIMIYNEFLDMDEELDSYIEILGSFFSIIKTKSEINHILFSLYDHISNMSYYGGFFNERNILLFNIIKNLGIDFTLDEYCIKPNNPYRKYSIILRSVIKINNNNNNNDFIKDIIKLFIKFNIFDISDLIYYNYINKTHINILFIIPYIKLVIVKDDFSISNFKVKNYKKVVNIRKILILINRFILSMKIFIRKIKNRKIKLRKLNVFKLLDELKNYIPNPNKKVLKNGSRNFIINKQKFNTIPPYHLHFGEIDTLNDVLISEKADGQLINQTPINIFPENNEFNKYKIKAEYIEELDLVLVFDINIPNFTIEERYLFLRKLHPSTRYLENIITVNNFDSMKKEILKDRTIFKEFMSQHYDDYRWYPKFSLKINDVKGHKNFCKNLISNIILEKDIDFLRPDEDYTFKSDGMIIKPLNGNREIKVKPKSEMTLDLKFNDNNWYDREGNNWSKIIKFDEKLIDNNDIYRCYPIGNGIFEARDYRIEKNKPNNYNVVTNIMNLHKYNWQNKLDYNIFYYTNSVFNTKWTSILENQNKILNEMFLELNPKIKSKWIDMGCGKSNKIYKKIHKKYNPSYYLGIDKDIPNLILSIQKFGKELNKDSYFAPFDLSKDWNNYEKSWYNINFDNKIDYIICNFSIMHFFTDKFWEQVNLISKKGTKMLLNLVNENARKKISIDDSYMYLKDSEVIYYFSNVHKNEMKEEYISNEKLYSFLKKYDWTEKKIYTSELESIEGYYTWYIIEKN
jgi:hypothetical protein